MNQFTGRWNPTQIYDKRLDAAWVQPYAAVGSMVPIVPSATQGSGTGNTVTVSTNGTVTFSSTTRITVTAFTTSYDAYMVVMRISGSVAGASAQRLQLSNNGTPDSSSNYITQKMSLHSTRTIARTAASGYFELAPVPITPLVMDQTIHIYSPAFFRTTIMRANGVAPNAIANSSPRVWDSVGYYGVAADFNGISIYNSDNSSFNGRISIYGLEAT